MLITVGKEYLGDSVFASWDGHHIILTTENGLVDDPSNTIALEDSVLRALHTYMHRIILNREDLIKELKAKAGEVRGENKR